MKYISQDQVDLSKRNHLKLIGGGLLACTIPGIVGASTSSDKQAPGPSAPKLIITPGGEGRLGLGPNARGMYFFGRKCKFIPFLADHTYVDCFVDPNVLPGKTAENRFKCWGMNCFAPYGMAAEVTGYGDYNIADQHRGTKPLFPDTAEVGIYAIHGVCHQSANRFLWPAGILLSSRLVAGYWASVALYGVYGTSAFSGWTAATRESPKPVPNPPTMLAAEVDGTKSQAAQPSGTSSVLEQQETANSESKIQDNLVRKQNQRLHEGVSGLYRAKGAVSEEERQLKELELVTLAGLPAPDDIQSLSGRHLESQLMEMNAKSYEQYESKYHKRQKNIAQFKQEHLNLLKRKKSLDADFSAKNLQLNEYAKEINEQAVLVQKQAAEIFGFEDYRQINCGERTDKELLQEKNLYYQVVDPKIAQHYNDYLKQTG